MKRRWYAVLACILSLGVIAGPVAAHDFTGSEEVQCGTKRRPRTCHTNNVRCSRGPAANAAGVRVYRKQSSPTSGGIGVCNDGKGELGSRVPVQGRVVAQGSQDGGAVYADGDRDNQSEQAKGWLRIDGRFAPSAPTVRCGDQRGRLDATHPTRADTQADCG